MSRLDKILDYCFWISVTFLGVAVTAWLFLAIAGGWFW